MFILVFKHPKFLYPESNRNMTAGSYGNTPHFACIIPTVRRQWVQHVVDKAVATAMALYVLNIISCLLSL
jgi:hypothetical protein